MADFRLFNKWFAVKRKLFLYYWRKLLWKCLYGSGWVKSRYGRLTRSEVFDLIYKEGAWGVDAYGNGISGTGSYHDHIVDPYVSLVRQFCGSREIDTAVDLGCGDFNVGSKLMGVSERYIACDVSGHIIDINKGNSQFNGVIFRTLDLCRDELPAGDVAFVRQVLQHLGNEDIINFVRSLESYRPYRFLFVTEHVPSGQFEANIDKIPGPTIRMDRRSGVDLLQAPFFLKCKSSSVVLEVNADTGGMPALIRTTLYEF